MRIFKLVSFALAAGLLSFAASSSPEPLQRLCRESDLSGAYELVELRESPQGEENAFFKGYPHQYLVFNTGRTYAFVASKHSITKEDELDKAVKQASYSDMHIFDRKYTLDTQGLLNLTVDGRPDYSYRCIILKKAQNDPVGDLILTGYSKKNAALYKLFHHWP